MAYSSIVKPSVYFNTKLYTGNGGTQSITGVGFKPDLLWQKNRSSTYGNMWFDAVRGASQRLMSNTTGGQSGTSPDSITSFDSDGFSLGADVAVNDNNGNSLAWNWKAGTGQGSSNTDGSINTTYTSVNTTAGFSISQYTGTGSNATVGHGLGVAPKMIIVKKLNGSSSWLVYNKNICNNKLLYLNGTQAQVSTDATFMQNTDPTSSVFSVGTWGDINGSSDTFIAYCFAEKTGYSKISTYVGNGSTDGTFVYTGFKPAWLMVKLSSGSGENWHIWDNKRNTSNVIKERLIADGTAPENANDSILDFLSNGFKFRENNAGWNGNGNTYAYMAFAEHPFVSSEGAPVTAR